MKPEITMLACNRLDMNRVFVPSAPPPPGDTIEKHSFKGHVTFPLTYRLDDPNAVTVFPDRPRQSQHGWGQLSFNKQTNQQPYQETLHFCDSARTDTFNYLPTRFKLGYHFEIDPDSGKPLSPLPPLRVEVYRDSGGSERIKATVVALPCIDADERQALRTFLDDQLLH